MEAGYLKKADESRHWEGRSNQIEPYYNVLTKLVSDLPGKRLLDVGCAAGVDTKAFADKGLVAYGVDVNQDFVTEAKEKFPDLNFAVGSAEQLPFKDGSFDVVFSINTLFYTNIEKSLAEFTRVLRPQGIGLFSFDTEIINHDEQKSIHADSVDHLRELVAANGAEIAYLGDESNREDTEPFRHRHTFRIVAVRKGGGTVLE